MFQENKKRLGCKIGVKRNQVVQSSRLLKGISNFLGVGSRGGQSDHFGLIRARQTTRPCARIDRLQNAVSVTRREPSLLSIKRQFDVASILLELDTSAINGLHLPPHDLFTFGQP